MSGPGKANTKMPDEIETFDEQIDILFQELSFAVEWKRPSILLAACASEGLRARAESALKKRLGDIGQKALRFTVDENHYDIPLLLSQLPEPDSSVFFVTGLSNGGGKAGANAYRALNIRREYFVEHALRVVVWLNMDEARDLSVHAPDFWAFRHREVEFRDSTGPEGPVKLRSKRPSAAQTPGRQDPEQRIAMLEAQLADLPQRIDTRRRRLELLFELAGTNMQKGALLQSEHRSRQGLAISRELSDAEWLAKFWGMLGDIFLEQGQSARAVRAYRKAIRYSPDDGRSWSRLGHFYHVMKRFPDAIIAYKHAIRLDKKDIALHSSLVACYRLAGKHVLAEQQKQVAQPFLQNVPEYQRAIFEAACGNTGKALDFLENALKKDPADLSQVHSEPNFDSIRETARFIKLTASKNASS